MSVNISISNSNYNSNYDRCNDILNKLFKFGINCRIIQTKSVVDNNIEDGCLITLGKEYTNKKNLNDVWKIIKSDYNCSHLKIDGIYDGCIYNYLKADYCPGNKC